MASPLTGPSGPGRRPTTPLVSPTPTPSPPPARHAQAYPATAGYPHTHLVSAVGGSPSCFHHVGHTHHGHHGHHGHHHGHDHGHDGHDGHDHDQLEDVSFGAYAYDEEPSLDGIRDACDPTGTIPAPPAARPATPPLPAPRQSFLDALQDVIQTPGRQVSNFSDIHDAPDTSLGAVSDAHALGGLSVPRSWRSPSPALSLLSYTSDVPETEQCASTAAGFGASRAPTATQQQQQPHPSLISRIATRGWPISTLPAVSPTHATLRPAHASHASSPGMNKSLERCHTPQRMDVDVDMDIEMDLSQAGRHRYRTDVAETAETAETAEATEIGKTEPTLKPAAKELLDRIAPSKAAEAPEQRMHRGRGEALADSAGNWRPVPSPLLRPKMEDTWPPEPPRERARANCWPHRSAVEARSGGWGLPKRHISPPPRRPREAPGRSDHDWNKFSSAETHATYEARGLGDAYHDSVGFYSAQSLQRRLSDRFWPDPPRAARDRTVLVGPIPDDVVATELAALLIRRVGPVDSIKLENGVAKVVFELAHAERARKLRHRLSVLLLPEIAAEARADPQRRKQTRIRQARKDARA